ncbi:MAG: galactokinase [Deltaproteobacteria bacterium]|nr:galactokinase [Deltaproteobacteria bacterium]
MDPQSLLIERHAQAFGQGPQRIASAPGRVNLIGEHTDYNEGFVFPMALERRVWAAVSRRAGRRLGMLAIEPDDGPRWDALDGLAFEPDRGWANYPAGVIGALAERFGPFPGGLDLTVWGDVPQGAGLSSSAALEVAVAMAVAALFELDIDGPTLARLAQRAEVEFVGVRCGIMDQFVSRMAERGCALLLDCRDLTYRQVPLRLGGMQVLVIDSGKARSLAGSAYNERRAQCEAGLEALQAGRPGSALRDYGLEDLERAAARMSRTVHMRCRHVIEENARVLEAEQALLRGDMERFGALLDDSHRSLRDRYQVSCAELDWIVERARSVRGVLGARMTGAGFGGCAVALVAEGAEPACREAVERGYGERFGLGLRFFRSTAAAGARSESG